MELTGVFVVLDGQRLVRLDDVELAKAIRAKVAELEPLSPEQLEALAQLVATALRE